MRLERVQSPECPTCGCNATELVGAGQLFGRPWARFQCAACDAQFTVGRQPQGVGVVGVPYNTVRCRCPGCNHVNPGVASSRGVHRYHKCEACGLRFQSQEIPQ